MNEFPMWNIGLVNGIETTYEVHWLEWDTAQVTVYGDEIVTFASSKGEGFTDVGDDLVITHPLNCFNLDVRA